MENSTALDNILSMRLFPKGRGAAEYRLQGIAALCDWAIMTDHQEDKVYLHGDLLTQPQTVFLSLRSTFHAIPYFFNEILPLITDPFVLITGSEDITIPNQVDVRWRSFNTKESEIIKAIVTDERLIHWFIENRDQDIFKTSSLPVGCVFENRSSSLLTTETPSILIKDRQLRVLCAHRVRDGDQWETRRNLTALCNKQFQKFATVLTDELTESDYQQQVCSHPFVLCAQGGGLDPSPKAWFSIANCSIPIIKSSALNDAYSQLPVVIIDEWDENCINIGKLQQWVTELSPYYDDPDLRSEVLQKLSLGYWWHKIESMITPEHF